MPIYTFKCNSCDELQEYILQIKDRDKPIIHNKCKESKKNNFFNRIIEAPQFHLKGQCWAKDGYSKKNE